MTSNESRHPELKGHINALDGVRGLAIILVLLHHIAGSLQYEFQLDSPVLEVMRFGWFGVDLFFVLSGFLITGILFEAKDSAYYYRNFYVRRTLRIFPLYFLALAVALLLRETFGEPKLFGYANPIWMWTYLTNAYISLQGFGAFGLMDHFWSLAVEEHFYLVWPFAVLLGNRRQLMIFAAAAVLLSLGSRTALALYDGASPMLEAKSAMLYVLTPLRMDSLAIGGFIALAVRGPGGVAALRRPALIALAACIAVIGTVLAVRGELSHDDISMQTFGFSTLAIAFGCLIVLALSTRAIGRALSGPVLRWFGRYSYGMYVWHPMIFILVWHSELGRSIRGGTGLMHILGSSAIALSITLVVTLASFHFWEKPFLDLKKRFEKRAPAPRATAALAMAPALTATADQSLPR